MIYARIIWLIYARIIWTQVRELFENKLRELFNWYTRELFEHKCANYLIVFMILGLIHKTSIWYIYNQSIYLISCCCFRIMFPRVPDNWQEWYPKLTISINMRSNFPINICANYSMACCIRVRVYRKILEWLEHSHSGLTVGIISK